MTSPTKILVFAGSARTDSFNRKLAAAGAQALQAAGAETTLLELKNYPLPLYDQDWESENGIPQPAVELREIFCAHDGLLIASPEYNSSLAPLLKNTIDWVSRRDGEVPQLAAFHGKTAAIVSASPGQLGGLRGLVALRMLLVNINVLVIPDQLSISNAGDAFGPDGLLVPERQQQRLEALAVRLFDITSKLR